MTSFELGIDLHAISKSGEKILISDTRDALVDDPVLKAPGSGEVKTDAPYIKPIIKTDTYFIENNWNENNVADVKKDQEKTTIFVSMENKWYIGALRKGNYSETRKKVIQNRYILLIAFYAFFHHMYGERLESDSEKQLYEKITDGQLELAARTVLTSLTGEKAYEIREDSV